MRSSARRLRWTRPTAYAVAYALGAMAWIVLSDLVVSALDADSAAVNIVKGFGFIIATALLLGALLRGHEVRVAQSDRRARDEVRELIDQSNDIFHMVDLEGRFVLLNGAVGRILGVEPDAALGRSRAELISGTVLSDRLVTEADVVSRGEPIVTMETVGEGEAQRHFRATRFPIRSSSGKIIAVGTVGVDLTDEERAQRELQASEAAYEMMFDGSPLPLWVFDDATLRMVAVNDAALALYGYSHDEFLQLHVADLSPTTSVAPAEPAPELGGVGTLTTHVDSRGRLLDVEIDTSSTAYEGRPATVVVTRDLTAALQASGRDRVLLMLPELYAGSSNGTFLSTVVERLVRLTRSTGGCHVADGVEATVVVGEPSADGDRRLVVGVSEGDGPTAVVTLWGKPFDYTPGDELACRLVLQQAHRRIERERFVHDLEAAGRQQELTLNGVARTLGAIVDTRDPYTAGHQQRVGELAEAIGRRLGLPDADVVGLRIGGYLHDIGKIATPFELLTRPGPLDADERHVVERHSRTGRDLLVPVPFPWPIAEMVDQHHERLDGSGYPAGLVGDQIIPEARIIAVADVFDAITSTRPYRPGRGYDVAIGELRRGAGSVYDAAAVDALVAHVHDTGLLNAHMPVAP